MFKVFIWDYHAIFVAIIDIKNLAWINTGSIVVQVKNSANLQLFPDLIYTPIISWIQDLIFKKWTNLAFPLIV